MTTALPQRPYVTVLMTTSGDGTLLRPALDALATQTYGADRFEIVVVLGGAGADAIRSWAAVAGPVVRVLVDRPSGNSEARNVGLRAARGDLCILLDDDVVPSGALVTEHVRAQLATGGAVGIGRLETTSVTRAPYGQVLADRCNASADALRRGDRAPTFSDCGTANLCVPTDAVRAAGGFRSELASCGAAELAFRLVQAGLALRWVEGASGRRVLRRGTRDLLRETALRGADHVRCHRVQAAMLPHLPLSEARPLRIRNGLARRALVGSRLPAWLLAPAAMLTTDLSRRRRALRLIDDVAYWGGVRAAAGRDWTRYGSGAVILMYHAIGGRGERPSQFVVTRGRFARQMWLLRLARCRVMPLRDVAEGIRDHRLAPRRAVAITFDDGYADNADLALPILSRLRLPATFFLVSRRVGMTNTWDETGPVAGRPLMRWDAVRTAIDNGVDIGAHTTTHRSLPELPPHEAREEVERSRTDLEAAFRRPVALFAYPYGDTDARTIAMVQVLGFEAACGVRGGRAGSATPLFDLNRTEITGHDSLVHFALSLRNGHASYGRPLMPAAIRRALAALRRVGTGVRHRRPPW